MVLYNTMKIKDKKLPSLTAIILAGGKSSRMGPDKNKSMLRLNGKYLIDIVISKLKCVVGDNIIIVGPPERYFSYKQVVPDLFSQKGPLVGIYSGLKASSSQYNLVVGCDMPFLEVKLLKYMTKNINSNDIVIPHYSDGYIEPLCAIYSKRCLETIERNLAEHIFSVRAIFPHLKVKFIEDEEIKKYDPKFYSFFNVNFKHDFRKAEELIKKKETE
ncbi:molybdenum cofactor guanylyltransferase [Candidatus Atribacteria bacterium HGW-Atribacteria-1]|nr:MAG: molybdenum cofactor guanylyltransferase [Candidatus Atribacteria bacterium HGW-Atribacteria-1]